MTFRPVCFQPTFQKHAGRNCVGVQLHVTDRAAFRPVRVGVAVLAALRAAVGDAFAWRTEEYEFVRDQIAIDLLFGSDRERLALEAGATVEDVCREWEAEERAFTERRAPFAMYR